jgi:hypothetical protein
MNLPSFETCYLDLEVTTLGTSMTVSRAGRRSGAKAGNVIDVVSILKPGVTNLPIIIQTLGGRTLSPSALWTAQITVSTEKYSPYYYWKVSNHRKN